VEIYLFKDMYQRPYESYVQKKNVDKQRYFVIILSWKK